MLGKSEKLVFFSCACCLLWFGFNPLMGREQQERLKGLGAASMSECVLSDAHIHRNCCER